LIQKTTQPTKIFVLFLLGAGYIFFWVWLCTAVLTINEPVDYMARAVMIFAPHQNHKGQAPYIKTGSLVILCKWEQSVIICGTGNVIILGRCYQLGWDMLSSGASCYYLVKGRLSYLARCYHLGRGIILFKASCYHLVVDVFLTGLILSSWKCNSIILS